jgi:hypothetical protein
MMNPVAVTYPLFLRTKFQALLQDSSALNLSIIILLDILSLFIISIIIISNLIVIQLIG